MAAYEQNISFTSRDLVKTMTKAGDENNDRRLNSDLRCSQWFLEHSSRLQRAHREPRHGRGSGGGALLPEGDGRYPAH